MIDNSKNVLDRVEIDLVIQEGLKEPLITDITIDELGIQVTSFSKGLWKHRKDSHNTIRRSAKT